MKKISVIIPCFNSRATIVNCVKSVLATGYRPLEIIVVDDCSRDETPQIVEQLVSTYHGTVCLLRQTENRGPAHSRNVGAYHATGEYLFFLDSDTELQPDALAIFVKSIETNHADAVSGIYHMEPLNPSVVTVYKALLINYFVVKSGVFEIALFNGCVAGIRKEAYDHVGGYNESLRWGMDYEHEDLGYRLQQNQKLVLMDPSIQARHEFPYMVRMTTTYFSRISLWMELFMKYRKFDAGGLAAAQSGIGTISVPLFLVMLLLTPFVSWVGIGAAFFFFLYLRGYFSFLFFALRKKTVYFPAILFFNLYFSIIISAGACYGALRYILGKKRVPH
jgi:glycosyltransferase involved in cell wall biosynthesis